VRRDPDDLPDPITPVWRLLVSLVLAVVLNLHPDGADFGNVAVALVSLHFGLGFVLSFDDYVRDALGQSW
jgi:hypothetical protein